MSQMTATPRLSPRPTRSRAPSRPSLHIVHSAPTVTAHVGYAVLLGGLIIAGLLTMLMLNMARAEGSFVLSDLRAENSALHAEQVTLETEIAELSSPATLARKAESLGMVASPSTATLRLSDNSVFGVAALVDGKKTFTVDLPGASTAEADPQPGE